jgi:hypothetical protein
MGNSYRVISSLPSIPPVETGGYSQVTPTEFSIIVREYKFTVNETNKKIQLLQPL